MALGYTLQLPLEDRYLVSKDQALDQITVLMGGRVAEELIFNEMTSGAHNDFERATELAKKMVTEFGMSALGPRTFGRKDRQIFLGRDIHEQRDYSEEIAQKIDGEIQRLIAEALQTARGILKEHHAELEKIVSVLLEKETIERETFEAIFTSS